MAIVILLFVLLTVAAMLTAEASLPKPVAQASFAIPVGVISRGAF